MRMKARRVKELKLYNKQTSKDGEGVTLTEWVFSSPIKAEVWPANGQLQVQTYGDRLHDIQNMKIKGHYEIQEQDNHFLYVFEHFSLCEGDGISLYSENKPDYKIISITPYKPLRLEIEKI